jgi:hypothetical protein
LFLVVKKKIIDLHQRKKKIEKGVQIAIDITGTVTSAKRTMFLLFLLPLSISSKRTPKLYTSDFTDIVPFIAYSGDI